MLEDDITALLRTNTTIGATSPIHLDNVPQNVALPKITLKRLSQSGGYSNDGPVGTKTAHFQIKTIALTATAAKALADAVQAALDANMSATVGGTKFGGIFTDDAADMPEPTESGRESPNQIVVMLVRFNFYG